MGLHRVRHDCSDLAAAAAEIFKEGLTIWNLSERCQTFSIHFKGKKKRKKRKKMYSDLYSGCFQSLDWLHLRFLQGMLTTTREALERAWVPT